MVTTSGKKLPIPRTFAFWRSIDLRRPRHEPASLDGAGGDVQGLGDIGVAQATEENEFNDLAELGVLLAEAVQGVVSGLSDFWSAA